MQHDKHDGMNSRKGHTEGKTEIKDMYSMAKQLTQGHGFDPY